MTCEITIGSRIDMVLVVAEAGRDKRGERRWRYRCDCGNEGVALNGNLLRKCKKLPKSCGCSRRKHGLDGTRIYEIWAGMMKRCYRKTAVSFDRYGARGISVHPRWHDIEAFYADMGDPGNSMSIERIDNDGNYSPDNCRWATVAEQARNRRSNRFLTFNGESKVMADWAADFGISASLLKARIDRLGWSIEEAITTPVGGRRA